MLSLTELKAKWFLDVGLKGQFPPQTRHKGSTVQASTDNNFVEPLFEGGSVMRDFNERVNRIIASPDVRKHEIWIASWRLDPVKLLGLRHPEKDAEAKILEAAAAGVKILYLGGGHWGFDSDVQDMAKLLKTLGSDGSSDKRFPLWGSQHQKFFVYRGPNNDWTAIVGSVDLSFTRWDSSDHLDINLDRKEAPTHDLSVNVRGPAVYDIALTFTERWNDLTNRDRTAPQIATSIPTDFLATPILAAGTHSTHSVQVLRTYAIEKDRGYSWSDEGEFTVWASYLNAIKKAQQYIYIEDQYFYPFSDPLAIEAPPGTLRDSCLVFQLGEAIKRGVDVVVLVPSRSEDNGAHYQLYQRGKGAHYLSNLSDSYPGTFVICFLRIRSNDPVVHSKLMIVDDEFVLVGSANFNQRSMTCDSEFQLGIVDSQDHFARDLRLSLWKEHLMLADTGSILDPSEGVTSISKNAFAATGRLRVFPTPDPGNAPCCHGLFLNHGIDPYAGPNRS